jgi:hypothetical protein
MSLALEDKNQRSNHIEIFILVFTFVEYDLLCAPSKTKPKILEY